MDVYQSHFEVLKSLHMSCQIFNNIFGEISPIQTDDPNECINPLNSTTMTGAGTCSTNNNYIDSLVMPFNSFTPIQREHIKYLSGHLLSAINSATLTKYLMYGSKDIDNDIKDHVEYLQKLIVEKEKNERKEIFKIRALQDYLVNELNRNEELEQRIIDLETKMMNIEDDKRKYMRKVSSLTNMNAEKAIVVDELVGRYVMKKFDNDKFFGLIIGFKNPFFQVYNSTNN